MTLRTFTVALAILFLGVLTGYPHNCHAIPTQDKTLKNTIWILSQEFDPATGTFIDLSQSETLQLVGNSVKLNGKEIGSFSLDEKSRVVSLHLKSKVRPAFTLYQIDDAYHYKYAFDQKGRLQLTPLDEQEGNSYITVEGKALLFEAR